MERRIAFAAEEARLRRRRIVLAFGAIARMEEEEMTTRMFSWIETARTAFWPLLGLGMMALAGCRCF